jgi:uncharacterized membrane protein
MVGGMVQIATQRGTDAPIAGVTIERVAFDAPWGWLAAGWKDKWTIPRISRAYGAAFALLSLALTLGLAVTGLQSLVLALAGGFLLIGPIAAVGLYEASRRLESGESITARDLLRAGLGAPGQLAFFGAILAFLYVVWLQLAFLLFMLFLGTSGLPPPSAFVPTLLFTPAGLALLVCGTAVGCVLAVTAFAISVVSVPLLMTRRADAVTAITASLAAVAANLKPLALWAALIAGGIILGVATLYTGLILAFPLIGHATWHAYRDLVREPPAEYL